MLKILFIFIIFLEIYIFNCYIVLPIYILPKNNYKSYASNTLNSPEETMSKEFFSPLITYLYIGTPSQKIYLLIKPRKHYFIVNSQNIVPNLTKVNYDIYDLKNEYSLLYNEKVSASYTLTSQCITSTINITKQICTANETIFFSENLNHMTIETESNKTDIEFNLTRNTLDNITGIIGLNLLDENNKNTTNFLSTLNKHNITKYYHWYFDFNNLEATSGKLFIDILPHEINSNKFKKKNLIFSIKKDNITPMNYYEMKFDQIYFINKNNINENYSLSNGTAEIIEFNFESNVIIGNDKCKDYISTMLGNLINQSICNLSTFKGYKDDLLKTSINDYDFYFCKKEKSIEKELNKRFSSLYFNSTEMNYTFEITKEQIIKKFEDKIFINIIFNKNAITN